MKPFIYRLKKLNERNGLAEIREKECEDCIRNEQSMEVRLHNDVMILTPEELPKGKNKRTWMDGKYTKSGEGYWLWRFEWNPTNDEI